MRSPNNTVRIRVRGAEGPDLPAPWACSQTSVAVTAVTIVGTNDTGLATSVFAVDEDSQRTILTMMQRMAPMQWYELSNLRLDAADDPNFPIPGDLISCCSMLYHATPHSTATPAAAPAGAASIPSMQLDDCVKLSDIEAPIRDTRPNNASKPVHSNVFAVMHPGDHVRLNQATDTAACRMHVVGTAGRPAIITAFLPQASTRNAHNVRLLLDLPRELYSRALDMCGVQIERECIR